MGVIDDIVNFLLGIGEVIANGLLDLLAIILTGKTLDRNISLAQRNAEAAGEVSDGLNEAFSGVFDTAEDDILQELGEESDFKPEDIEGDLDDAEGAAIKQALTVASANLAVEAGSLGQLESHDVIMNQVLATLVLDDVLGARLQAVMEQGVMPALEAREAKRARAQFVSLQDAHEYALRGKNTDEEYLQGVGAPPDVREKIGSNEPENPNNLLEEWGIRDDQLEILERVGLEPMEFEELTETPAELGLVVPDEIIQEQLDLAGYPERTKAFLSLVNDRINETARGYQELLITEELVGSLDGLVQDGVLTPQEAVQTIPQELLTPTDFEIPDGDGGTEIIERQPPLDDEKLQERFELLRDVPAGSPSGSDFEGAFASGYLSLSEFRDRLDQTEYPTDEYKPVLQKQILDELDGDLQEAVAVGLLSENEFSQYASFAGLDQQTTNALLSGLSFSDITKQRLKDQRDPAQAPVSAIQGIGDARSTALEGEGIETVADLAGADADQVADATNVSPETAEGWIQQAQQLTN